MSNENILGPITGRFGRAKEKRQNYNDVYEDISRYINPNREDFISKSTPGERRHNKVYDSIGIDSARSLASALTNSITNPQSKWVNLVTRNTELMNLDAVRRYLTVVEDAILSAFNSTGSGFYQQNHQLLLDLPSYGTAAMFLEDSKDGIVFTAVPLSQIYIEENFRGAVDTVYREFELNGKQVLQEFRDTLSEIDIKDYEQNLDKIYDVVHCVIPKEDYEITTGELAPDNKPFVSIYFIEDGNRILDTGSFHEQPYVIPRWEKLTGEVYGRGSGWNALSDILTLNVMGEAKLRTTQMTSMPAYMVPDDGVITSVRSVPGGITVGGVDEDGRPRVLPLPMPGNLNDLRDEILGRQDSVRKAFFVDRFEPKAGTPISATESRDQQQLRLTLAAPQLFRLEVEYLNPLIDRLFGMLQRSNKIPPAPSELQDQEVDYEYQSPIIKAQRNQELVAFNTMVQSIVPLLEANPDLLDIIDAEKIFRENASIAGIPIRQLRTVDEYNEIQKAKAEARAEAEQAAQQQEQVDAVAKLQSSGVNVTGEEE